MINGIADRLPRFMLKVLVVLSQLDGTLALSCHLKVKVLVTSIRKMKLFQNQITYLS